MPDLPTPQNAAEAALLSECWDAVLSYADLCTSGSASATQLATEAFTHGIDELRAATAASKSTGTGRRALRLPRIPLLLASVRTVAAAWETNGLGHRLDPDLRLWLHSDKAARYVGPPLHRPLALRGLRDMQEPDAVLLWLAEVESLPMSAVARRLGLDPAAAATELAQVRVLFRDRCHRNHLDTPMDAYCRSYARLLDAVTRSPSAETPEDLSRHLARCVECAEAAACLRLHGGGLPAALSSGVIGWGGLAYLERRRRAAEAGMIGGRTDAAVDTGLDEGKPVRPRIGRTGILVTAVLVSALALTVSLMPFGGSKGGDANAAQGEATDGQSLADPGPSLPSGSKTKSGSGSGSGSGTATAGSPAVADSTSRPAGNSDQEAQGESSSPAGKQGGVTSSPKSAAPDCRVKYEIVSEWPDGFQATVTVTSTKALATWSLGWTFKDGQHVGQMWDGTFTQDDSHVTATAADYNKTVTANGTFTFGFVGSWTGANSAARDFTLNTASCQAVG
ncbi:cellulose-binding domain-containing protein [Streptomyces olivochromogenes]|uniref:Hydrolase n=1 Tax=Streptomyces olivochromogenes TaxID=1963 RepID=A0A250VP25_STROL|nr:cellulose-binding domain-containing protein [Streptomyces olivochromogenes]KUN43458.1 cellulose-binding protein [Streptomyces olivochromogenes]GAX55834.1 hydrolase [Streptomyces olivochromogenes]